MRITGLLLMFGHYCALGAAAKSRVGVHGVGRGIFSAAQASSVSRRLGSLRGGQFRVFSGGKSVGSALDESDTKGKFVRSPSTFRDKVSREAGAKFPPAKDRYHLYISHACPWANRCSATLRLKRLEDVIGLSVVHPTWQATSPETDEHVGWTFKSPEDSPVTPVSSYGKIPCDGCIPDHVNGAKTVRELYEKAAKSDKEAGRGNGDPGHKFTVPILWDKEEGSIVNNESEEILRMLNSEFKEFEASGPPTPDLYPEDLREQIHAVNSWVYENINDGVYKSGFAKSQEAYDEAVSNLYASLDKAEAILSKQRYLTGHRLTEADIRLFMTLVRFDEVYVVYFKCNKRPISSYPNLVNYCRDLYQTPGIGESINMEHIRRHYYTSHPTLNAYSVIPAGPNFLETLKQPHDRAQKFQMTPA